MKKLILALSVCAASTSFAKSEEFVVKKVLSSWDLVMFETPSREQWLMELGSGCRVSAYGRQVFIGSYGIEPNSAGATLTVKGTSQTCRIWRAEKIN